MKKKDFFFPFRSDFKDTRERKKRTEKDLRKLIERKTLYKLPSI